METHARSTERVIEVTAADLPLHCPTPAMSLWNAHPRVFLPIEQTGQALCPYCGTLYKFTGELPKGRH
ncbi:MAG: zinc-finger domain-containing protein [Sulfuricellaceae bacterium]|jgi:uncharacterized Zn-finger protein